MWEHEAFLDAMRERPDRAPTCASDAQTPEHPFGCAPLTF